MNKVTKRSILIVASLMSVCGIIYFVTSYTQSLEGNDPGSQIQTMFFATAGIVYIPLGIWMLRNRLHSRGPYVISILVSILLVVLYVVSRTINLPLVGVQKDIGIVDIITKIIQIGIIAISVRLVQELKKEQILPAVK
ncbi:MAG TPA: hypothetical protein VFU58_04980 [Candidatus Nitrosotalea sp.]|nr:hypothetical protein [Candidatus Nitrosotalea sp.]